MKENLDIVGDVRTIGLLGAVELVQNPATNKRFAPDLNVAPRVIEALHERGVICRPVTFNGTDIICFAPPIVMNNEQINTLVEKLHDSVLSVQRQLGVTS